MNRDIQDIRTLLGPLDPEPDSADSAARRSEQVVKRRPGIVSRRTMLVGSAAAAVVAGVGVVQVANSPTRQSVELLATPTPLEVANVNGTSGLGALIERLATAAENSPGPAVALPAVEYLLVSSWYLDSTVAGQSLESQLRPHRSESWRRADESWTVVTDGRSEDFAAGSRAVHWPDRPPVDNPAVLSDWLNAIHPMSRGDSSVLTLSAITDLLRERVLLPTERAAVLRLLGTIPGLRYSGTAVDRAGRLGEALVLNTGRPALPTQHTVVVEPVEGTFLAYEEMLTEDPGALGVSIPAVLRYETYLGAELQ